MWLRIMFFGAACIGMYQAFDSARVTATTHGAPAVVSIDEVAAHPEVKLPRYVEIKDAHVGTASCTYNSIASDEHHCEKLLIGLLTKEQVADAEANKPIELSVVVKADPALVDKCNQHAEGCLENVSYRGVTESGLNLSDDEGVSQKDFDVLRKDNMTTGDHTAIVIMGTKPGSYLSSIALFFFCALIALATIFLRAPKRAEV